MSERDIAIRKLFDLCEQKYNIKIDINYNIGDKGNSDIIEYLMCYDKNNPDLYDYCGPDWTFIGWPSANILTFEEGVNSIIEASNIPPEINKVGWFGNIDTADIRKILLEIGNKNTNLFDIDHISPINGIIDNKIKNYKSFSDLLKYKILIDIEGNGYSGRFKYLMYSKRPILFVDRIYTEYFYNDLKPFVHYIPVKNDLSDLIEKTNWAMNNYDESLKIANNTYEYAIINFTREKLIDRIYIVYNNIKNYYNKQINKKLDNNIEDFQANSDNTNFIILLILVFIIYLIFKYKNKY
jgi:hypothetical protein